MWRPRSQKRNKYFYNQPCQAIVNTQQKDVAGAFFTEDAMLWKIMITPENLGKESTHARLGERVEFELNAIIASVFGCQSTKKIHHFRSRHIEISRITPPSTYASRAIYDRRSRSYFFLSVGKVFHPIIHKVKFTWRGTQRDARTTCMNDAHPQKFPFLSRWREALPKQNSLIHRIHVKQVTFCSLARKSASLNSILTLTSMYT